MKAIKTFYNQHCRWWSHLNQSLDNVPKQLLQRTAQLVLTIFMYFSGIMLLLLATFPNYALANHYYLSLEPYTFYFLDQTNNIIFAFIFISLGRGIGSRVKKAFWPTTIVLIFAIANTLWKQDFPIGVCIISIIILLCLWLAKGCLYRDKLSYSWGQIIVDTFIFLVSLIFYLFMGSYIYHRQVFIKFTNPALMPSKQIWLSGLLGLAIAILIVIIIYRYLAYDPDNHLNNKFNGKRVKNVIKKFGGNEISHLAFNRDKQIYFYQKNHQDQVFFMYKKIANKLVVMGEPVGNKKELVPALDQFLNIADKLGLSVVFYEVGEKFTMLLHERGFDFTKFGEEGFLDLNNFTLRGSKHRGDRALIHKFQRNHYQFKIIKPPFKLQFLKRLKRISDNWLGKNSEKGFSLGFFTNYYISQAPVAVMEDKNGRIISFASMMPEGNHLVTSVDLMRSLKDAPSGMMDGVFISLFKKAHHDGYQVFNLGMAPLANVGESRLSFLNERTAHLIFEYGSKFYSFQGLRAWKEKYASIWKPRYIVYRKHGSLIFTMLQLIKLVNQKIKPKTKN